MLMSDASLVADGVCEPLVRLRQVDFAYRQQLVLKHIDLAIPAGTTLGLIGPNGGGKTTLIRLLLGQIQPTRGQIAIAGLDPRRAVRRGDIIGYLPQSSLTSVQLPLSVRQTIRLGLAGKTGMLHPYRQDDLEFVESLMHRVGLAELAGEPLAALSGGQLQRVYIARALASRPKLLLLDEPTTGIDAAGQKRFVDFLVDLKNRMNLTVVLVSHDLRSVSAICDRIACLNVTLHYHDVPHRFPAELAHTLFSCNLAALGIEGSATR